MILHDHRAIVRPGVGYWCPTCDEAYPCHVYQIAWQERRGGPGHRCQCRQCHPERFPAIPGDGAPYVSLHGWKGRALPGFAPWQFAVEFNGQRRDPDWCITEALAGELGWLVRSIRHDGYPHYGCVCGGEGCQRAEYGCVVLIGPNDLRVDGAAEAVQSA